MVITIRLRTSSFSVLGEFGRLRKVSRDDQFDMAGIYCEALSTFIASPGSCTAKEAGVSIEAVNKFAKSVPILGACLGQQKIVRHLVRI